MALAIYLECTYSCTVLRLKKIKQCWQMLRINSLIHIAPHTAFHCLFPYVASQSTSLNVSEAMLAKELIPRFALHYTYERVAWQEKSLNGMTPPATTPIEKTVKSRNRVWPTEFHLSSFTTRNFGSTTKALVCIASWNFQRSLQQKGLEVGSIDADVAKKNVADATLFSFLGRTSGVGSSGRSSYFGDTQWTGKTF